MPVTSEGRHLPYPKGKKSYISHKISKIMHEGIRGHKTSKDQAIAVALEMSRRKEKHGS